MSTDTKAPIYKSVLEFKSTSFSVPVLVISNTDLKQIDHQLDEKISQAPEFFKNSPLLVDIQNCNDAENPIEISALSNILFEKNLFPIGISGGSESQVKQAHSLHIPVHTIRTTHSENSQSSQKLSTESVKESKKESISNSTKPNIENMLISQPIRSGQRIYSKGDLTVLSHVSAGAEIMAEGNIHVYGSLRGRALAGVQGNTESRIFCSDLQAELVSIAGHYKISEELDKAGQNTPSQVLLQKQTLIIKNL